MTDKDTQLLAEAYENINKAIHADDTNVTHEYSEDELINFAIIALKDLSAGKNLSKIEWLIKRLEQFYFLKYSRET